ncbi:MAG: hypothetical protein WC553_01955 [Patescibacteria group bacterium]
MTISTISLVRLPARRRAGNKLDKLARFTQTGFLIDWERVLA